MEGGDRQRVGARRPEPESLMNFRLNCFAHIRKKRLPASGFASLALGEAERHPPWETSPAVGKPQT